MRYKDVERRVRALKATARATTATTPGITIVAVDMSREDGETPAAAPALRTIDYRTFVACLAPPDETHHEA